MVELKVTLMKAQGLIAKDRNVITGKKTSSDPFVELFIKGRKFGKSKTVKKNLNPIWNETFTTKFAANELNCGQLVLLLKIYDEDLMSSPDDMGSVELLVDPAEPMQVKEWLDVEGGTGEVQVKVEIK